MEKFFNLASVNKKLKFLEDNKESDNEDKKRKCRKYDNSYLDFGFTSTVVNNEERPQCALCFKVLSIECMLPSKLKRHLESVQKSDLDKPREYFCRKLSQIKEQKPLFASKQATISNKGLLAYRVAKYKKPRMIAEELVLSCDMDMVNIIFGESMGKQLLPIPLSDSTISRRIQDLGEDLQEQIIEKLRGRDFGLELEANDNNKDLLCAIC
jgi:hypothetical protein